MPGLEKRSLLEIACFDVESAIQAKASGAHRIELCANREVGGLTPSHKTFLSLKKNLENKITINVMIRPHGNNFEYSTQELLQMRQDITEFRDEGANGFVFGVLKRFSPGPEDFEVHAKACGLLVQGAGYLPCTFHRAFDCIPEEKMLEQLEVLIDCGFSAVLTSGKNGQNAVEGKDRLKTLVDAARGRIAIIVGGGVRSSNVKMLREETGAQWFHSSAIVDEEEDAGADEAEIALLLESLS